MSTTILYVEDSMGKARRVSALLEAADFCVIHAATVDRAAELAYHHRDTIKLVLSDTDLRGFDGFENIEIYRSHNFHIIGSSSDRDYRFDWRERGVTDFFEKMDDDSEMPAVIARINALLGNAT